jgi:hypothetical protein
MDGYIRVCINFVGDFINIYRNEIRRGKGKEGGGGVEKKNENGLLHFMHVADIIT